MKLLKLLSPISILEKAENFCNKFIAVLGVAIVLASPVFAFFYLPRLADVVATAVGCSLGSILATLFYSKVSKKNIIEEGKNKNILNDKIKEQENEIIKLKNELQLSQSKSVSLGTIKNTLKFITAEQDFRQHYYRKELIEKSDGRLLHDPFRKYYHALYEKTGKLYLGCDITKLMCEERYQPNNKSILYIYGNLSNFSSISKDSESKMRFAQIEKHKFRENGNCENQIPREMVIEACCNTDIKLAEKSKEFEDYVNNEFRNNNMLFKAGDTLMKKILNSLLTQCLQNVEIKFIEEIPQHENLITLESFITKKIDSMDSQHLLQ